MKTSTGILLEVYGSVLVYLQDIESAYIGCSCLAIVAIFLPLGVTLSAAS